MPAEVEEVVVYADAVQVEHVCPDTCQLLLISMNRFHAIDIKTIIQYMYSAFYKLKGVVDHRLGRQLTKNYLEGNQDIYITGFTLEAGAIQSS
jgi:hypothetical protein